MRPLISTLAYAVITYATATVMFPEIVSRDLAITDWSQLATWGALLVAWLVVFATICLMVGALYLVAAAVILRRRRRNLRRRMGK